MKIPLFPLDVVLFPGAALPLHIFEPRYKDLTQHCLQHAMEFGVVRAWRDGLAVIGCTASILSVLHRYPDGRLDILCRGEWRFEVESLDDSSSYLQAEVDVFEDVEDAGAISTREQREQCAALHMEMLQLSGGEASEFPHVDLDRPVAFLLAASIPSDLKFKQELLRERSDATRTSRLVEFYHAILPKLRRGAMVSSAARSNGHVM
ncbi:MAG TPA: LON peptidase substrate-binding domain-containing protein [Acidobacteriaceae bacterium]|nr:LON peptidase substrate-binding domain-containing protein [Acidobacteriaceae bacterium]